MSGDLNPRQFHEMSRDEFESQRGTYFHGTPTGVVGSSGSSFHVGSKAAAEQALGARVGSRGALTLGGHSGLPETRVAAPDPQVIGGRIESPMVNIPGYLGSYGKGTPGDMHDSGDVMANAREMAIRTRGQKMRQGIYYMNVSEDSGSTSAIVPDRSGFRTHEDYLVEARAQGKKIPKQALKGYSQIPGQQRLVF